MPRDRSRELSTQSNRMVQPGNKPLPETCWPRSVSPYGDILRVSDTWNIMMTSSNGNSFRVTGHLCGEFTGNPGELPTQRPVTRSFDVFFDLRLNKRLSKQSWGWWFETLSRPLWRRCNVLFTTVEVIVVVWFMLYSANENFCIGYSELTGVMQSSIMIWFLLLVISLLFYICECFRYISNQDDFIWRINILNSEDEVIFSKQQHHYLIEKKNRALIYVDIYHHEMYAKNNWYIIPCVS